MRWRPFLAVLAAALAGMLFYYLQEQMSSTEPLLDPGDLAVMLVLAGLAVVGVFAGAEAIRRTAEAR